MKVRARICKRIECPDEIKPYVQEPREFITIGEEYEVHAISFSHGLAFLQIVDDIPSPRWYPYALFELAECSLPRDWICNLFPENRSNDLVALIGPEFVAGNRASYESMVQLEADLVDLFWKRIDLRAAKDSD